MLISLYAYEMASHKMLVTSDNNVKLWFFILKKHIKTTVKYNFLFQFTF